MSGLGGAVAPTSRDLLKSLTFASDYEFLPKGVQTFKNIFDRRMNEENLVRPFSLHFPQSQACYHLSMLLHLPF
jgi:hypothetical protein